MWYEILPTIALVYIGLAVPPYAAMGINWLMLNGKVKISIYTVSEDCLWTCYGRYYMFLSTIHFILFTCNLYDLRRYPYVFK